MESHKVTVRLMEPEERSILVSWRPLDVLMQDMIYIWYRNRQWEKYPPIVTLVGDDIVGTLGATYAGTGYVNVAFIYTLPEYRHLGLATRMLDYSIKQGLERGMTRLRLRCHSGGGAEKFWRGFGIKPIGTTMLNHISKPTEELWFDLSLIGVTDVLAFIDLAPTLHQEVTTSKRMLSVYRRAEMKPLTEAYQQAIYGDS